MIENSLNILSNKNIMFLSSVAPIELLLFRLDPKNLSTKTKEYCTVLQKVRQKATKGELFEGIILLKDCNHCQLNNSVAHF